MTSAPEPPPQPAPKRRLGLTLVGAILVPLPLIALLAANCDMRSQRLEVATIPSRATSETQAATQPANAPVANLTGETDGSASNTESVPALNVETTTDAAPSPLTAKFLGVWEDDYQGHRTLTLNNDGSGKMVVELSGLSATLFAAKLEFGEEWTFDTDEQLLTMTATGGEPQGKVNLILKMYGRQATYKVVDVTEELLVLVDQADQKRYEWRRVEETQP